MNITGLIVHFFHVFLTLMENKKECDDPLNNSGERYSWYNFKTSPDSYKLYIVKHRIFVDRINKTTYKIRS